MNKQSIIDAIIRVYDNGGKTADRYTVVYMNQPEDKSKRLYSCVGMSANPFHGVGQHTEAQCGPHLGKRITYKDLPGDCQSVVRYDLDIPAAITFEQCVTVTQHYLIAALWADAEEGTSPRIPVETIRKAFATVVSFLGEYPKTFLQAMQCELEGYGWHPDCGGGGTRAVPEAAFGHDLWLTTAGHGTGFWDRKELGDTLGDVLTAQCKAHGEPQHTQYRGWFYID